MCLPVNCTLQFVFLHLRICLSQYTGVSDFVVHLHKMHYIRSIPPNHPIMDIRPQIFEHFHAPTFTTDKKKDDKKMPNLFTMPFLL
uniref:Secreted protein n=1 Tax=Ascaris lumbricoides TaxID=6252 RepID=A0A0M3HJI5_ASCLU